MPENWQYPVNEPLFVDARAREVVEEAREAGKKPKAHDTLFRFSDSGNCSRALAYSAAGVEPEEWDVPSLNIADRGTTAHERLQAAIQRRFPGFEIELTGIVENASGHCDGKAEETCITAVVSDWTGGRTLYEHKQKSGYQFDQAVGVMQKQFRRVAPKGPGLDVIIQAGINALAHDCETVVIGYERWENYSVNLAQALHLSDYDRFLAEWWIPREVWEPLARKELDRFNLIENLLRDGMASGRFAYDDKGELVLIDPEATVRKPGYSWRCGYCDFKDRCVADGPGIVPVEIRS